MVEDIKMVLAEVRATQQVPDWRMQGETSSKRGFDVPSSTGSDLIGLGPLL
jgi:hypothetical protein